MDAQKQEKIAMWQKKLIKLEKEYEEIMQKRGEAMQMGDLRENAAFLSLSEDADTWRVRIEEIRNIINKIEKEEK